MKLAVERRARLEESRKLWQFYWDMADEENWIKEKEQILSTGDIGHDLTTIHLLISKHKALEEDIASHEPALYSVVNVGEELIQQEHFGMLFSIMWFGEFCLFTLWNAVRFRQDSRTHHGDGRHVESSVRNGRLQTQAFGGSRQLSSVFHRRR